MKVILLQDVKGLGKKNDLVEASNGYANNYLLKRGLAVEANTQNVNTIKKKKQAAADKKQQQLDNAKDIKSKIDGKEVIIKTNAGENGKLFGSITSKDISEAIKKQLKVKVDKKKINLTEPIKQICKEEVQIKVYAGITAVINVTVTT